MTAAVNAIAESPGAPVPDVPQRIHKMALVSANRPARMSQVCRVLGIDHDADDGNDYGCLNILVNRGEAVYTAGTPLDRIYLVVSGTVKVHFQIDRTTVISDFLLPGAVLGLDAFDALTHVGSATAVSDALLLSVPYSSLVSYGRRHPELDEAIMRLISGQIARAATFMTVLARSSAEARVAYFLVELAFRAGRDGQPAGEIDQISRRDISLHLGLAYETAVRVLNRFRDEGAIAWESKRILIKDYRALQDLCSVPLRLV